MVAGRFSGETMVTSCLTATWPGSVSSQLPPPSRAGWGQLRVAARLAGGVDDPRAGFHALDRLGGHQPRGRATRHERRGDDDVEALDRIGEGLLLLGLLLVGE